MLKIGSLKLKNNVLLAPIAGYTDMGFRALAEVFGAGLTYTEMVSAKGMVYNQKAAEALLKIAEYEDVKKEGKKVEYVEKSSDFRIAQTVDKCDCALNTTSDPKRYSLDFANWGQKQLHNGGQKQLHAVQIFGSEPEFVYKAIAAGFFSEFDLIDINMGCPVPKIVKNGEGSALLKDVAKAAEVVAAAVEASKFLANAQKQSVQNANVKNTSVQKKRNAEKGLSANKFESKEGIEASTNIGFERPITIKTRLGFENGNFVADKFCYAMEKAGAAAVTVHGRYREQFYMGSADIERLADVKAAVTVPFFANGDIATKADLEKVRKITKADGFMIGRAALGKPWIFAELTDKDVEFNAKTVILLHLKFLLEILPTQTAVNNFKKHLVYYGKGTGCAKGVRLEIAKIKTLSDMLSVIENYF